MAPMAWLGVTPPLPQGGPQERSRAGWAAGEEPNPPEEEQGLFLGTRCIES